MADISNIKPNERVIEMVHPADETQLLGIRVSIMTMSDERMKKIRRQIQDEKLRLDARGKNFKAEDVEENQTKLIFGAMTDWEWYNPTGIPGDKDYDPDAQATFKGQVPPFNRATVFAVLNELEWFAEQLSAHISDEKAFF